LIQHLQATATSPTRVVILGGTGFLGRDLLERLNACGIEALGLSSHDLDLTATEAADRLQALLRPSDALVFAAALTPDRGKDTRTMMRNLAMGENVSAALERSPCAHIIYVSSDAAYADDSTPITESMPCAPNTLYGLMHRTRELMVAQAARRTNSPMLVVRPCAMYGAADTHNSYGPNRFVRSALTDGRIVLFGQGEEKRDHVAVGDVSRLILNCLTRRTTGTLNVATGQAVSFADVADRIGALWPSPVRIEYTDRSAPVIHRHFDSAGLLRAFPTFVFTPLGDGLRDMISTLVPVGRARSKATTTSRRA
jgi:nucleoside-diphosphate-sugar epimerase